MSRTKELPELVQEFVALSKTYVLQETVEPAKRLGRYAGMSMAAGLAFGLGALFLGIAAMRFIIDLLPEGPMWNGLGYLIAVAVLAAVAGILVALASRRSDRV